MGDPNATDIPAAAAADSTSLFRAMNSQHQTKLFRTDEITFIPVDIAK